MNPYLDPQNNPHIIIKVKLSSWHTVDCLIDTGFTGGIVLPDSFLKGLKEKPVAYQEYELADGSFATFAVYQTKVKFKKVSKELSLFFTKSKEGLIGMEFLYGFKLVIDLRKMAMSLE